MAISQYWVDQIPARPIAIEVRDSSGTNMNLTNYDTFNVRILGSRNEEIDLTGAALTGAPNSGRFLFTWPEDRSLFTESGDYVMQLELVGNGRRDFTTVHHIRVRELGRVN